LIAVKVARGRRPQSCRRTAEKVKSVSIGARLAHSSARPVPFPAPIEGHADDQTEQLLRRVRNRLARDHEFPNGSSERGYDFIAPLDDNGHLVASAASPARAAACAVWPGEREEVGHLVHKPGGAWAFHYDIHGDPAHDETGFHLDTHIFKPGEYVSVKEQDEVLRTFRVISVREVS
jgi:hypothetical protein